MVKRSKDKFMGSFNQDLIPISRLQKKTEKERKKELMGINSLTYTDTFTSHIFGANFYFVKTFCAAEMHQILAAK